MSGNQVRDRANSLDLLKAAFLFAARNIRCTHGSKLVMKYFESQEAQDFRRKGLC
jgi:23S rRNA U2552 (ribose-2'-O)-methylase RlmE/FtsJ